MDLIDRPFARRRVLLTGLSSLLVGPSLLSSCTSSSEQDSRFLSGDSEVWLSAQNPQNFTLPRWPIEAAEKTIPLNDGNLYYLEAGAEDEVIVLLHAMTGSARSWGYQIPVFSEAGYRVVAPSLRGAYGTTAPMAEMERQLSDITTLIEHLNVDKVHLIGTAYGGMLALRYAMAHPDRLKSLTLSCTLGGVQEPSYAARQKALLQPEFTALPAAIKELGPSYRHSHPEGVAQWVKMTEESGDAAFKALTPNQRERIFRSVFSGGPDYASIRALVLPVNLIFGGADLYAPPSVARLLHSQFQNSRLTVIQETGHAAFWEQPDVFNKAVLEFLSGLI